MWKAAGLEEPGSIVKPSGTAGPACENESDDEGEVDNMAAGGFFARFGRDASADGLGEHAGTHLPNRRM